MNKSLIEYIEELKRTLLTLETKVHDIQIALKVLHQINRGDFTFSEDRSSNLKYEVSKNIPKIELIEDGRIYAGAPDAILSFLKREKRSYNVNDLTAYLATTNLKGKKGSRRNTTQAALYRLFRRKLVDKVGKGKWAYKESEGNK